jgi:anti-sigma regulatory factor (Ser/Thr protein kinase)
MQRTDPSAEPSLALEIAPVAASVSRARRMAAELARRVGADAQAVELAVAEAVGNAVLHAYPSGPTGTVTVRGAVEFGHLIIVVRDDGVGMRPDPDSRGLGFGLPLIAQVADAMEIAEAPGGGTHLRMRFPIPPDPAVAG